MSSFFGSTYSFPHYAGLGRGFENSSKFFLFALSFLQNYPKGDHLEQLKLELFSAIAVHLNFQSNFTNVPFFKPFRKIVIFEVSGTYYAVVGDKRFCVTKDSVVGKHLLLNLVVDRIFDNGGYSDAI